MEVKPPIEREAVVAASKLNTYEMIVQKQVSMPFDEIMSMATHLQKSKFFPEHVNTPEKALAIMMTSRDLGIPFTFGLQAISVIGGRPCLEAKLLLALVFRTRELEEFKIDNATEGKVVVSGKRKGMSPYQAVWTRDRADKLGVTEAYDRQSGGKYVKDNWKKQPQNMLTWRAVAEFCRFTFPDAISGCYIAEEIADEVVLAEPVAGQEPKITEVIEHKQEHVVPEKHDSVQANELLSRDIADDQLGEWLIPAGQYKGQKLITVVGDRTPTGRLKGAEYLDDMGERAQDENAKDIIVRFMTLMRKDGVIPETGYDAKDIPNEAKETKPAKKTGNGSDSPAKA